MDAKARSAVKRVYEDFEPSTEWVHDEVCDTLLLHLPGYKKEQLRVQVTTLRNLKIAGERPLGDNKWNRFQKEFPISANFDSHGITAKFEGGILYVRQPKMITPAPHEQQEEDKVGKPTTEAPKSTQELSKEPPLPPPPPPQSDIGRDQHAAAQQVSPVTTSPDNKQANGKAKTPEKKKEPPATDGKSSVLTDANNVSGKKLEKKTDSPAEAGKVKDSADDAAKMDGGDGGCVNGAGGKDAGKVTSRKRHEKHEKLGDSVDGGAEIDDGGGNGGGKHAINKYKHVVSSQVKELKKPSRLMNLVVALLFAVVIGLYVTNAIRSYGKSYKKN